VLREFGREGVHVAESNRVDRRPNQSNSRARISEATWDARRRDVFRYEEAQCPGTAIAVPRARSNPELSHPADKQCGKNANPRNTGPNFCRWRPTLRCRKAGGGQSE
jgi:hypothetical protein